ncbi:trehalose-6-phosphate synthase [Actinospica robiniae]|uniref:trehalose-6-phosphate synthase n=1 Tax=Actinospica robiniae TaxID=304901 RepID=UPI00146FC64C|nr:trehalose-6-phosphate synthase [Actinospica robiniae]
MVTCSNSGLQVGPDGSVLAAGQATPGGLVPILTALLSEVGGRWIFSAPGLSSGEAPERPDRTAYERDVRWQPLALDQALIDEQRESITIRTLLWTFHYLHDTATAPLFSADVLRGWGAYEEVNRRFADAMAEALQGGADEVALVHDFHLMLVPGLLAARTRTRGRAGRLAYFHHIPWCEPDYFGLLPDWMIARILESLLTCDFVGFHSGRWADAFAGCVERFLPDAVVDGRRIAYRGRETVVTVAPGPIDAAVLDELSRDPKTDWWRQSLTAQAGGRRLIVRVDRMDLWKNVARGFAAYRELITRRPAIAEDYWFCAIVSMPRLVTERHREYRALCEDLARSANDACGAGRDAVTLVYPDGSGSPRNRAAAALSLASAVFVNPTFDGLNMVAKEAVVLNPDAPLLLSVNAGVYPQLAGHAVPIQPFDVSSTADALESTLFRSTLNGASEVAAAVRSETAATWLQAILHTSGG